MTGRFCVASLFAALLCSGFLEQRSVSGMDWLAGLTDSINQLNRNIQHNVQQLNQQVQETVQGNLAQAHRVTENLDKELAAGNMMQTSGGNNVVLTNNDGTKIVQSGRTSDGKQYVRESTDKIVGDTLRHVDRIYDPATKTSRVYGYTLNLKDRTAKPVPIDDAAA